MTNKNKIVVHSLDAFLFITGSWIYNQIIDLSRWQPVVVCKKRMNQDIFPFEPVYSLDSCSTLGIYFQEIGRILLSLPYHPYIYYALKRKGVSLLHSHFGNRGYYDIGLKKKLVVPLITTFYGYDLNYVPIKNPVWKERYMKLFSEGDLFLVEGSHMKECLVELGCPREKITVQHLGVDLEKIEFIPRRPKEKENIKILVAGAFREKKGIPYALEAYGKVRQKYKNMELTLIGDSGGQEREEEEKRRISQVIEKYKLQESVRLLGFKPHSVFLEEAAKHDIFLSPSVHSSDGDTEGGAPVSIIEASASGMPILSTYHCDIPEVVIDRKSGFLVPERDVDALAEKLEYLVLNNSLWEEMGRAGRKHIEDNYNIIKQREALETIYDSLVSYV
ncbi:MAG: hypothetical protein A2W23_07360 [Planctomycetes bacterium RBG_16_43_13]|nr:MAG: hypothetical protein A2W23_07360 [Planctomycetes bacterium RBG_16_43_13]